MAHSLFLDHSLRHRHFPWLPEPHSHGLCGEWRSDRGLTVLRLHRLTRTPLSFGLFCCLIVSFPNLYCFCNSIFILGFVAFLLCSEFLK